MNNGSRGTLLTVSLGVATIVGGLFLVWVFRAEADARFSRIGWGFLALSLLVIIWRGAHTFVNIVSPPPADDAKGLAVDPGALIKAIGEAPVWVGLAAVGAILIVFGIMLDGYRFADGGFTNRPPAAVTTTTP